MADPQLTIFEQYPVASWTPAGGTTIAFSVRSIRHTGGNRLVPHKRLRRDGSRFDDTGCEEDGYELAIVVINGNLEPGVPIDSYPDAANALIESFRIHEVGDLVVPTVGKRRCRLATFDRREDRNDAGVDACAIVARWSEDNEDDEAQQAFQAPSAASAASKQAEECGELAAAAGPSLGDTLDQISAIAEDLEGLANAPGEFVADIETQANQVMTSIDKLNETASGAAARYSEEIARLFTAPETSIPGRALVRLEDTVRRAVINKLPPPFSRIVEKRYPSQMSVFTVAVDVQQDPTQLMALNAGLEDLLAIPANEPIRVYA